MKEQNELPLRVLYENRSKLIKRIDKLNDEIKNCEARLNNTNEKSANNIHAKNNIAIYEKECQEIINILQLTKRPLKRSEINNYLDNNLGIYLPQTGLVLKKLKNKNIIASLKINNSNSLSYWVMSDWIDWDRQELKKEYKKFGVNKNFSIKKIEVY